MDKADKRALEKYPKRKDGRTRNYACSDDDVRRLYAQGYRKAEKDLALTSEDIHLLDLLMTEVEFDNSRAGTIGKNLPFDSEFYGEVLRRFNEYKSK